MNRAVAFLFIILIIVSINCRSLYIAETLQQDPLYKYNKHSVYVKEKASAIQRRYMYYPPPYRHDRVGDQDYKRWIEFVKKQQDDVTIDALLYLYHTSSKERVQRNALHALSHQKKTRLIPLWKEILETPNELSYGFHWFAISGLENIQTQQSRQILVSLFSNAMTSPEILLNICRMYKEYGVPQDSLERILQLTNHPDENVRCAAYQLVWCDTEAARNQILRRAITDKYDEIVKWGLRAIGTNITPELFPDILKFLNHPDVSIRVLTDNILQRLFSDRHSEVSQAQKFEMCWKAFNENQWNYQDAPLLTMGYAKYLEDTKGKFAEADKALQSAQESYASNSVYYHSNHNPGATMLFRLIQVKRKRSDIAGALDILNRLVNEYPAETKILTEDFPNPWNNTRTTVGKLEPTLRKTLENVPIRIVVNSESPKYPLAQDLTFNVSIFNNRNKDVTLYGAKHGKHGTFILPASVTVESSSYIGFSNVDYTKNVKVKIPPRGSISYIATLHRHQAGKHLIDFSFSVKCDLENGEQWNGKIYGNSVTVDIQSE